ncbi:hypothetical protein GON01_02345 [Sphingomonas sp. MAH-20]|uniref:Uncharacterized protein n=1 Tax=Sphingomonas horti TaxID=2682842 RepID=A0A6I4IZD7_9SPHN|nr:MULTISPECIES: hypothetical protein [Sphingomonas]MBA2920529.1 hypothetical protein [Sphingomonas sp. CGMCC 1.13658]MVO76781.1 hypothetical protein [Sphingomonas horti]
MSAANAQGAQLRTAQARFVQWFSAAMDVSREVALQLWCKVNGILASNTALARVQLGSGSGAEAERSFDSVQRGIGPYVKDILVPVLGALAAGTIFLALDFAALPAAIAALVVFVVLLFRRGGSIDGFRTWIDDKLEGLKKFGF